MKRTTIAIVLLVVGLLSINYIWDANRDQSNLNNEYIQASVITESKEKEEGHITASDFVSIILDRNIEHEIRSRTINSPKYDDVYELNIYFYDFEKVRDIEQTIADLDTQESLKLLFQHVTDNVNKNDNRQKWLIYSDFISKVIRHPPLTQPMHEDKTMITHPLVLLLLGEGRCGHVARVIYDTAMANDYEARLVTLAAHQIAEVKYDGSWHFIDSNADFPLKELKKLSNIPSVMELAKKPYLLDAIPARGWQWSEHDRRTTSNSTLSHAMWYPANLLTSSIYFGDQLLKNLYSGNPKSPRDGIIYCYKSGDCHSWQKDRYYGWNNYTIDTESIESIPIEFFPPLPRILAPTIVYKKGHNVTVPIRFLPVKRIRIEGDDVFNIKYDNSDIYYEIKISSQSRGWDYDYRNYRYMPKLGNGDIRIITTDEPYRDGMYGVDFELNGVTGDIYVEILPKLKSLEQRGAFIWPSSEHHIQIYPENYKKWNYGRN